MNRKEFRSLIETTGIDHIDFGCSKGGSLEFAKRRFGGIKGLGIDNELSKVEMTRAAGFEAILYDIKDIPDEKLVNFCILSHFLEHIPSHRDVKLFVRKACTIAKQFVFIQQPYFDADPYLFDMGFKLFWSDWTGHPNRMSVLELWLLLSSLKDEGLPISFSIGAYKRIIDSSDPSVHPLASKSDQHFYNSTVHPPKDSTVLFDSKVFYEVVCLITLPGCDHQRYLKNVRVDKIIIESSNN
jgi:hypothetical protein